MLHFAVVTFSVTNVASVIHFLRKSTKWTTPVNKKKKGYSKTEFIQNLLTVVYGTGANREKVLSYLAENTLPPS